MATTPKTRKNPEAKARKRPTDDREQYRRFRAFAQEHDVDEDKEKFDRTFEKLVQSRNGP